MKTCMGCLTYLQSEDFAIDRSKSDGRKSRCRACDAASSRRRYYASSTAARSSRTTRQRNRRWRDIAEKHGERWLMQQAQALKGSGRLTPEAVDRARQDARLAAFFREANRTSPATLRKHLGARLWDRVAPPRASSAEHHERLQQGRERIQRLLTADLVDRVWNDEEGGYEGVWERPDDEDDRESFAAFLDRAASDAILRHGLPKPAR